VEILRDRVLEVEEAVEVEVEEVEEAVEVEVEEVAVEGELLLPDNRQRQPMDPSKEFYLEAMMEIAKALPLSSPSGVFSGTPTEPTKP
jgi:hypothetical protein